MKWLKISCVIGLLALLSGCGPAVIAEIDVTKHPTANMKKGESCAKNILGFVATGDASIAAAARDGEIDKIATVDTVGKPGFFVSKYCTVVTGK